MHYSKIITFEVLERLKEVGYKMFIPTYGEVIDWLSENKLHICTNQISEDSFVFELRCFEKNIGHLCSTGDWNMIDSLILTACSIIEKEK